MNKVDFFENLLDELDDFSTVEEIREHISFLLEEAIQDRDLRFYLSQSFNTDD